MMREEPTAAAETASTQGLSAASAESLAPLPPEGAFVVQFRVGAGPAFFAGRVEHIPSARAARFGSAEELVAFLTQVLADVRY